MEYVLGLDLSSVILRRQVKLNSFTFEVDECNFPHAYRPRETLDLLILEHFGLDIGTLFFDNG
jgi:hypothetical protein